MPNRYLTIPPADARRLGLTPRSTVAVREVVRYPKEPGMKLPSDRWYEVRSLDGVLYGSVITLSGWKLAKNPTKGARK